MRTVLSIAGSDSIGGAGIQADLKTIAAHGLYGMTVITALTAQNTLGVSAIHDAPMDFVASEIDAVFTDIFPDAVKIGMVSQAEIIGVIAERLRHYGARNIVVDPVMVSTSGHSLLQLPAQSALKSQLLPLATLITPNIPEAEVLSGLSIRSHEDMIDAAAAISQGLPGAVLIKGGHGIDDADDLLWMNGEAQWFPGPLIDTPNTHGTGCTLSSAIACGLAEGKSLPDAVGSAKAYITGALKHDPKLGHGHGPLDHNWQRR